MDFRDFTIRRFHKGLLNKEFSAAEAAKAFLGRIEDEDGKIGAYLRVTKDIALSRAREVDVYIAGGHKDIGTLAGAPIALKDNILIEGEIVSAGSRILSRYRGSYNATAVLRLNLAKAVILGQTNMDEFAMGSSTENSAFGKTRNPYDLERVPGGSSGGSAAAVASGFAIAALGADTGGSIRQPAAFCGVVGLKPTYGAVSRYGLIAMASSLDQIGPITKTVEDAEIVFEAIRGGDGFDATSPRRDFGGVFAGAETSLKIGLPKEYFVDGIEPTVRERVHEAIERLKKIGFIFKEISLPHTKYALSCYYIIMPAEVSANLARLDGIRYSRIYDANLQTDANDTNEKSGEKMSVLENIYFENRGEGFGREARRRVFLGAFVLSHGYYEAYYTKAQKVRRLIKNDFEKAFGEVDVILTPVAPTLPFYLGEKTSDPLSMYLSDVFTIPASLAGLPAISIPVKKYKIGGGELPVGFQLIGRHFREADILAVGKRYEKQ